MAYQVIYEATKLFYLMPNSGYYPETWNHGLFIQYTFHSIILLNSLRKLLSSLAYNHVENEIERKDILSPNQAGFIKKITKQVIKNLHFLV